LSKICAPFLLFWFLAGSLAVAQQKQPLELEDIFKRYRYYPSSVYGIEWMKDGRYYSSLAGNKVVKLDITTGQPAETLVDGNALPNGGIDIENYSFSADEQQMLLEVERESIYRRSFKSYYYVYNRGTKKLTALNSDDKLSYATFSPDGSKVAYVRNNNLFYVSLDNMQEVAITTDGRFNEIINGGADWVYEEEFSMSKAFAWSPNSQMLAFWRFNESKVTEYNMQVWGNPDPSRSLYPEDYRFKYPKAGEDNAEVAIKIFHLNGAKTVNVDIGAEKDIYIPRMYWQANTDFLSVIRMNRLQNVLEILHANTESGATNVVLKETAETYVDINFTDDLTYLNDGKSFIRTSEQDGYKHIYHYKNDGTLIRQITQGNFEAESVLGIDQQNKVIYYLSTEDSPLERHVYSINFKGKKKTKLTERSGTYNANFSPDFSYYIEYFNSVDEPNIISLRKAPNAELVKVLEDNAGLKRRLAGVQMGSKEFFSFAIEDGTQLNGYMIKPHDFDPNKQYPVLMFVYGGPGSQTVTNSFGGMRNMWFNYLANQGYIIVSVDNRGTGARGRDFKHITYAQLGKYEAQDQIAAAKYLGQQSYVDASRIGIWGWSYGGYMSSLCLFLGNDVFKMAVAVAPVSNWRLYDTIYTERYLKRPQDNESGYDAYSPLSHVDKLKGNFLLIHGTGDDNVHFQNSVMLQEALIQADKYFDSFYYPDRNHGIYGRNATFHIRKTISNYVLNNL